MKKINHFANKLKKENSNTERKRYIDCVKGFAIICVVLGHINREENVLCNWIYSFHLPVFFIVSGILFNIKDNWKIKDTKNFIVKKVSDLLWPYVTFSIITIIMKGLQGEANVILEIVQKTICFDGYSVLWFLPTMFIAEVLFYCLFKKRDKREYSCLCIFVLLLLLNILCTYYLSNIFSIKKEYAEWYLIIINIFNRTIVATIFMILGYYGYEIIKIIERKNIEKNIIIVVGGLLFIANIFISQRNGLVDLHYSKLNNMALYYLCANMGSWGLIYIMKYFIKSNTVLEYFGKNSLIVMCTHLSLSLIGISKIVIQLLHIFTKMFYVDNLIILIFVLILECIIIQIINNLTKFIIKVTKIKNKKRKKKIINN